MYGVAGLGEKAWLDGQLEWLAGKAGRESSAEKAGREGGWQGSLNVWYSMVMNAGPDGSEDHEVEKKVKRERKKREATERKGHGGFHAQV